MKNKKLVITFISSIIILALFNYVPMLYCRITGNGGDWVEYYYYNTTPNKLLDNILQIKEENKQLYGLNDTTASIKQNEYVYIMFYHENKYYHSWVSTKSEDGKSLLIFGGVSLTPNYNDAKLINRDMGYLSKQKTLNKFNQIVLNKLTLKLANSYK